MRIRYYQGIAAVRPYGYFVWANLAALALSAGPAVVPGLVRSASVLRQTWACARRRPRDVSLRWADHVEQAVPAVLAIAALAAVLIADLSGMSKAETERIWLPFGWWLVAGLALLPPKTARWAATMQVLTALLVNHLVLTQW